MIRMVFMMVRGGDSGCSEWMELDRDEKVIDKNLQVDTATRY